MHFTKICRKIGSALNFNKSIQWSSIDFRSVIATLALIALFGVPSLQAKPIKHVLLVNSYNQQMTWVKNITKGVGEVLQPEINRIEIDIENLNTKVFNSPEYYDQLERYLTTKYKNHPIDLILSSDNNAYNFLRSRRDRIFGPVPMVFSGVNDFSPDQLKSVSNITGVAEIFSAYETVTTALTLHPETKEVFIINDYLTTGRAWERDTAKQLEPLKDKVLLRYAENLTIQELKSQVASLSPNTIVLLGVYFSDRNGESFTYESIGREIANASSRPLYTLLNFNIGHGAIGGKVIGGYSQGAAMASIAMQVLHGITVDQIPVQMTGTNKYVFDYLQLEKFSIKVSNLPPNSVVINKPFSVFEAYKLEIVIFSIIALISIVLALVLISHRHTSALLRVREQHDKAVNLMIKNGGIGLWDWNPQTNMIIHHGSWANRLGYDPSELTMDMKSWIAKFHPDDLEKSRLKVIDFIEGSFSNFRNTYRIKHKDGHWVHILDTAEITDRNEKGEVIRVLGTHVDISSERELQKKLQEAIKTKDQFFSILAHDLRGPVGTISNILNDLVEDGEVLDPKLLKAIRESSKNTYGLLEELLQWARAQNGTLEAVAETFKIQLPITKTLSILEGQADAKGLQLKFQSSLASSQVTADLSMVTTVIRNILSNAIKFTPNGGSVEVGLVKKDGFLEVQVIDTGIGIGEKALAAMFKVGEKSYSTQGTNQETGTGFGLILCAEFLRANHGEIGVRSELGKGSTFWFTLPTA